MRPSLLPRTFVVTTSLAMSFILAGCTPQRPGGPSGPTTAVSRAARPTVRPAAPSPFDARFIDSMVPHHEMAVTMAREALGRAEHPEIKQMAQAVIDAQQSEIARMNEWRRSWYPSLPPTGGLGMSMSMGGKHEEGPTSASGPFDDHFIDSMIPHHEAAIAMAQRALAEGGRPEIKETARGIIDAQQREIEQMKQWRRDWYGH